MRCKLDIPINLKFIAESIGAIIKDDLLENKTVEWICTDTRELSKGDLFIPIKGEKYESLAEGYYTVKALMELSERYSVELPICRAVYKVLYEGGEPRSTLTELFKRSLKQEF